MKNYKHIQQLGACLVTGLSLSFLSLSVSANTDNYPATITVSNTDNTEVVQWSDIGNAQNPITITILDSGHDILFEEDDYIGHPVFNETYFGIRNVRAVLNGGPIDQNQDPIHEFLLYHIGKNNSLPLINPLGIYQKADGSYQTPDIQHPDLYDGLTVSGNLRFFGNEGEAGAGHYAVRSLIKLSNGTNATIDTSVILLNRHLQEVSHGIHYTCATSDGDQVEDHDDLWYVVSPTKANFSCVDDIANEGGSMPSLILSRYGSGAEVIPYSDLNFYYADPTPRAGQSATHYEVSIAAGETVYLMNFLEITWDHNTSLAHAPVYNDIDSLSAAGLLDGLDSDTISSIVNYNERPASSESNTPAFELGSTGLFCLLGLLTLLQLRRSKQA